MDEETGWLSGSPFHLSCPETLSQIRVSGLGMPLCVRGFALASARLWVQVPQDHTKRFKKTVTKIECPGMKSEPVYLHSGFLPGPPLGFELRFIYKSLQSLYLEQSAQVVREKEMVTILRMAT